MEGDVEGMVDMVDMGGMVVGGYAGYGGVEGMVDMVVWRVWWIWWASVHNKTKEGGRACNYSLVRETGRISCLY